jgi:hypothetical protein
MPSWRFASLEREPFARTGTRSERVRGLAAHGLKGVYPHRCQFVATTRWWPPFCLTIDWVAATIIIIEIVAGGHHHAKYNHRDQDTGPDQAL